MEMKKLNRTKVQKINLPYKNSAADTLKEFLEFEKITQTEFAGKIGVTQKHVSDILNRKKWLTPLLAVRIEQEFGLPARFLLRKDMNYKLDLAQQEQNYHIMEG